MIRLILAALFLVVFLILSLPVQLVLWLISFKWPKFPDKVSYPLVGWAFRVLEFLVGSKLTVIGLDRVPRDTPVLYIGNHRSFFDTVFTYSRIVRPTIYLAKMGTKKVPGLNIWMYIMHCIFLDRDNIKQGLQCILKCIDLVNDGYSVTIFPEGTRNHNEGTLMPFHEGSFKVATKTGIPIVPIAISGSGDVFEDHLPWIKKTNVKIEYLEPIYIDRLEPEEKKHIGAYTRSKIAEAMGIEP
ncbi:MAG: 1-acyl-sn-glycerol-3-phosphate acyltransferase [Lachnospiraceae bacterium]|nr:1-acyl-sn-glycerol-3-phosphate acyltransferase [Lachnospiraceae bacterium]